MQAIRQPFCLENTLISSLFQDERPSAYQPLLKKMAEIQKWINYLSEMARREEISIDKENEKIQGLKKDIPSSFTSSHSKEVQFAYQVYKHTIYCKQMMRKIVKERIIDTAYYGKSMVDSSVIHGAIDRRILKLLNEIPDKNSIPDMKEFLVQFSELSKEVNKIQIKFKDIDWNAYDYIDDNNLRDWKRGIQEVVEIALKEGVDIRKEQKSIEGIVARNSAEDESIKDPEDRAYQICMCMVHHQKITRKVAKARVKQRVDLGKKIAINFRMLELTGFCEKLLLDQLPPKRALPPAVFFHKIQRVLSELERMTQIFLDLQSF